MLRDVFELVEKIQREVGTNVEVSFTLDGGGLRIKVVQLATRKVHEQIASDWILQDGEYDRMFEDVYFRVLKAFFTK